LHKVSDKLGKVIKAARLEKHLTQKQLAQSLAISPYYLMSIENRRQIPSSDLLFRIIRELGISADTIFYPEYGHDSELVKKLQILINKCDEQDITVITATLETLLLTKNPKGEGE